MGVEMGLQHAAEFRRCLEQLDVPGIRKLWAHVSPHLAQPKTDLEALTTLHIARTQAESLPLRLRQYSYKWLRERDVGFLSLLSKKDRKGA